MLHSGFVANTVAVARMATYERVTTATSSLESWAGIEKMRDAQMLAGILYTWQLADGGYAWVTSVGETASPSRTRSFDLSSQRQSEAPFPGLRSSA